MKKEIAAAFLALTLLSAGCGKENKAPEQAAPPIKPAASAADTVQDKAPAVPAVIVPKGKSEPAPSPAAASETPAPAPASNAAPSAESSAPAEKTEDSGISTITIKTPAKPVKPTFDLPYDIEEDRKNFDMSSPDIVVGDRHYMTQINDWYMNFNDYRNKTVVIEGYFLSINDHYFVGRNGPTCPYCTGGYVDFEFTSDQDFTGYKPASTWIKVYGILRQGTVHLSPTINAPFYHIEALRVEKMDQEGLGTITD